MIAREGIPFVVIGFLLTLIILWVANRFNSLTAFGGASLLGLLTILTTFFFRDPDRQSDAAMNALLAPADGRIVVMQELPHHEFIGGPAVQVSIFLSVFDVHVNRVPISGVIDYVKYNRGKFLAAFVDKASMENEQTEIGMTSTDGTRIVFKQIAGLIARRIVCRLAEGQTVERGERFGLIRFGSRTDLIVPAGTPIDVALEQTVLGGETVIARIPGQAGRLDRSLKKEGQDVD